MPWSAPEGASADTLADAQAETSRTIQRLIFTLLGLGAFGFLVLGFPDSYLLTTRQTVSIPGAGPTSYKVLLVVGPALLVAVRLYLEVYLDHWRRLDVAISEHGEGTADHDLTISPLQHPLLRRLTGMSLFMLVPSVLCAFAYKAAVFPWWAPIFLAVAVITAIVFPMRWFAPTLPWRVKYEWALIGVLLVTLIHAGMANGLRRPFQLELVELDRSKLSGQDLRGAILDRATLKEANLISATLFEAQLNSADIREADLTRADLGEADLADALLQQSTLVGANLRDAGLTRATLDGAKMKLADLSNADLDNASLVGADLTLAVLRDANMRYADLRDAVLINADLKGAVLLFTNLDHADLTSANLVGTTLLGASFRGADLSNVKLNTSAVEAEGSDLHVSPAQQQLSVACGDRATKLPPGLTIQTCPETEENSPFGF